MPVAAPGWRLSRRWWLQCWHGTVPATLPWAPRSGQRAGHSHGPPTGPSVSPVCPLHVANSRGQRSPLASYQTVQPWSCRVLFRSPIHPAVCLYPRACPSEAFPSGSTGGRSHQPGGDPGGQARWPQPRRQQLPPRRGPFPAGQRRCLSGPGWGCLHAAQCGTALHGTAWHTTALQVCCL